MTDIKSLTLEELEEALLRLGEKRFRAKQIFTWLHQQKVTSFEQMSNISKELKQRLEENFEIVILHEAACLRDRCDQTQKYLFELQDGSTLETVLMKYRYGYSICISSQVGCRMGCSFCASTLGGLTRNLMPSEMAEQIYAVERKIQEPIHSVVVMGTGEPFDNYDHLMRFIDLISDENGRNLSKRSITVSTCGLVDQIRRIAIDQPQINLAISLHTADQEKRMEMMPIAKRYDLEELIGACRQYTEQTHRRITFEYSLIQGKNDSKEDAERLASLIKGMLCHVNLIPVNPVDEKNQVATEEKQAKRFMQILEKNRIQVTMRRSLGKEIDAACGQLRNRHKNKGE